MKNFLMVAILALSVLILPITASINFEHGSTAQVVKISQNVAQAQEVAAPVVAPEAQIEEVAQPNWFDAVLKWFSESGSLLAGLAMVFEIALRFIPTAKPKSILIPAKYAFTSLAVIFGLLGDFIQVLIEKANNVKK